MIKTTFWIANVVLFIGLGLFIVVESMANFFDVVPYLNMGNALYTDIFWALVCFAAILLFAFFEYQAIKQRKVNNEGELDDAN